MYPSQYPKKLGLISKFGNLIFNVDRFLLFSYSREDTILLDDTNDIELSKIEATR